MAKIKKIKLPNDETIYELEGTVTDISKTTSSIDTIQTEYPDIDESDKASTLFGKIKKFLSDLKSKVSSLNSDLANKQDAATAITTSNIGSQSVNYATSAGSATNATNAIRRGAWWTHGTSHNANDVVGDTVFAYNDQTNTATTGVLVGFSNVGANAGSYTFQLQNSYGGNGALYHRNRNGDKNTWNAWKIILDSSNYSSYALPLSGGTLKGTLNISGNYSYKLNDRVSMYDLGTTVFALCANGGATVRRYDNANKYAGISANAFTNVSSRLIKKNIKNISDDEAKKILDLRIVDFDYEEIVGGETGQIGLIAEETIDIFPHCVKVPDNYNEETTKQQLAEGKVLDLLELDYSKLVAPLIKMVQIQQRQIEELKAEVERLKDVIES